MAILNDLIVRGATRCLNTLYANSLQVDSQTISGNLTVNGYTYMGYSTSRSDTKLSVAGITNNQWYRSTGSVGWYSDSYGGGIYMTDPTYVKTYNNKAFYAYNGLYTGSTQQYYLNVNGKLNAADGVFSNNFNVGNSLVSRNISATNLLRAAKYDLQTITQVGSNGTLYVAPSIQFPTSNTTSVAAASTSITIIDTNITSDVMAGVVWRPSAKVKISGTINGVVTGTVDGTITSINTSSKTMVIGNLSGGNWSSVVAGTYTKDKIENLNIMMYETYQNSTYYPVGILLTSYGSVGEHTDGTAKTFIDIFGGSATKPVVRLGSMTGLDAINGVTPSGWGLYTSNGYFSGLIVSTSGKIGGWSLSTNSLTTGTWGSSGSAMLCTGSTGQKAIGGSPASTSGWVFTAGANFGVTSSGALYANSAHISGEITATSGTIGGASITDGTLLIKDANISGKISANHIDVSSITIGSLSGADNYALKDDVPTTVAELTDSGSYLTTSAASNTYATQTNLNNEINARKAVYGTSSTDAGTATKAVTCSNFALYTGASVTVTFSKTNTSSAPQLNVNSTGAKPIKSYTGANLTEGEYKWAAGATITFTYDGTNWRMQDGGALQAKIDAASSASTASSQAGVATQQATNATNAKTAAESAKTAAESAKTAAQSAKTAAETAKGAAETASSQASSAKDAAVSAKNDAVSAKTGAETAKGQAQTAAGNASQSATNAANSATAAAEVMGGFTILWNYSAFTSQDNGEGYLCAFDPVTGTKSDANGWVKWNGVKRTITKQMINPNTVLPYNIPIYVVCRLSSATATTGTNYMVWYNSGWKYAVMPTPTAVGGSWTWADNTDIILGKFVETASEAALTEYEIYNPPYTSKQITTNVVTAQSASASAASAAYEEQYIYISKPALTVSVNGTITWVTAETHVVDGETVDYQNTWTRKRPTYDANYPVLFIAKQRKAVDGTITCTTPIKDDTTTIIDGGHIITGTLDASAIGTGYLRADCIEANSLSIGKINGLATELDKASKTADSYIANFNSDEVSGAFIHKNGSPSIPSDPYANGVLITDNIDIIRSGASVANYGNVARIGKLNTGHLEITNADITAYGRTGGVAIKFGSKNNTLDGIAEVTERLIVEDLEDDNNIMTGVWLSYNPTYIRSCYIDDGSDPMTSVQVSLNGHIAYNNTDLVIGSFVIITYGTLDLIPYLQIGENAHANGGFSIASDTSTASGNGSIAIGMYNKSVGDRSASFGRSNKAYGECSFACGSSNSSSGISSFSVGTSNEASGNYSSAIGIQNISAGEYQTVIGKYNIKDNNNRYVFIIGNGSTTSRSNALTVDWNGNLITSGGAAFNGNTSITGSLDITGSITKNGNSLFKKEDVTVTVTYAAGTIGSRGGAISLGTTSKSGYAYLGAFILNNQSTSSFSAIISRNDDTANAMLLVYRATGNAVSNAEIKVRKIWVLNSFVTT